MSEVAAVDTPEFDFTFHPSCSPFTASQQAYLSTHPNAQHGYIAVGALVFDNIDSEVPRILLLQRSASDSMPNRWEVPGGGCDDEDPSILYAVARELWEEAGLKASWIGKPIGGPHSFSSRSGKEVCKFSFMVQTKTDADKTRLDPEEHQRFVWASEGEVRSRRVKDIELDFTTKEQEDTILQAFNQITENQGPKRV